MREAHLDLRILDVRVPYMNSQSWLSFEFQHIISLHQNWTLSSQNCVNIQPKELRSLSCPNIARKRPCYAEGWAAIKK